MKHEAIRASAGSGKTHQLTNRYLALLAQKVSPDAILATTFTRKAAGEILDRVLERLAKAASAKVDARILAKQIEAPDLEQTKAIALLREALQNLHRMRISTLDSFYLALAGSFALELGLPAGWSIGDEQDHETLVRSALEQLLAAHPDDIVQLLHLLNKGESKRSVQAELMGVIGRHYQCYCESKKEDWEALPVPAPADLAEVNYALEALRSFPLANNQLSGARDKDVAAFRREDWRAFLNIGLSARIHNGNTDYHRQQIPAEVISLYETLLGHVRGVAMRKLGDQTRATWDFLDRFHVELSKVKAATPRLRFDEVTLVVANAFRKRMLKADGVGFRLGGTVDHLLLDEFQDTSLLQWHVLEPLGKHIVARREAKKGSFFCVGDVKQAIYRWRGGMSAIFDNLGNFLGPLETTELFESRRSAQPIIDVVNQVLGRIDQIPVSDKVQTGMRAWARRFEQHTTSKKEDPGYVCLHAGPAASANESGDSLRQRHLEYVAKRIAELAEAFPQQSMGILCRRNDTITRLIFELRRLKIEASEEGGGTLTDSPAVEVVLSLLTVADHPGHSAAWFHVRHAPFAEPLRETDDVDRFARELRVAIMAKGYGLFVQHWARQLAPACNRRDLDRLQQLVEIAYDYQARSTLRTDEFIRWVRGLDVPSPTGSKIRVMTIHRAKGLEFDVVVLPELDINFAPQPPAFVVGRDEHTLAIQLVCRYANLAEQRFLPPPFAAAFTKDYEEGIGESLSLLYVAMTRPVSALYAYLPGPGFQSRGYAWRDLLQRALVPAERQNLAEQILYEHGDRLQLLAKIAGEQKPAMKLPRNPQSISFKLFSEQRRGVEHSTASAQEGNGRVALGSLFPRSGQERAAVGTVHHDWFSLIEWLDQAEPDASQLRAALARKRVELPSDVWLTEESLMKEFFSFLRKPQIRSILSRSAYPAVELQVERERRYFLLSEDRFLTGTMDRIVWLKQHGQVIGADIIDFKTDNLPDDEKALKARAEHYRPQLDEYRLAASRLSMLPMERITARLVFTATGTVHPIA
jgi:ATP-dependent exoDNAse (exonuclease V) beta subunit